MDRICLIGRAWRAGAVRSERFGQIGEIGRIRYRWGWFGLVGARRMARLCDTLRRCQALFCKLAL